MGRINQLTYFCIAMLSAFSVASSKRETPNGEKRVKDLPSIDIGLRIPELRETRNDTISVALYPSAMPYFIDAGLIQSENNIKLLNKAIKQRLPVRIRVCEENQLEIASVLPATHDDIARYRKSLDSKN